MRKIAQSLLVMQRVMHDVLQHAVGKEAHHVGQVIVVQHVAETVFHVVIA